jgi:hypothetical protein
MYSYDRATGLVCAITRGAGSWFLTAEVCVSIRAVRVGFVVEKWHRDGLFLCSFISHVGHGQWAHYRPHFRGHIRHTLTNKTSKQAVFFSWRWQVLLHIALTDAWRLVLLCCVTQCTKSLVCSFVLLFGAPRTQRFEMQIGLQTMPRWLWSWLAPTWISTMAFGPLVQACIQCGWKYSLKIA